MYYKNNGYMSEHSHQLCKAARDGHLSKVRELVHTAPLEEALRVACIKGHYDVVWFLLENGADIHVFDDDPLRCSVRNNHVEIARLLLDRGANIHANHEHALAIAIENRNLYLMNLLLARGATITNLIISTAVHYGHHDIATRLRQRFYGRRSNGQEP